MDPATVSRAEAILKIDPARRPVYAYAAFLHPDLGRIGLIVGSEWFTRDPHGVSRCDSGGLAGCVGGFGHLTEDQAARALEDLTHVSPHRWEDAWVTEVKDAFGGFRGYIAGAAPRRGCYKDARQTCIDAVLAKSGLLDPRLWVWEVRSFSSIARGDIEAVALAHEAWKELHENYGDDLPIDGIRYLVGRPADEGLHHFREDEVVAAFERGL